MTALILLGIKIGNDADGRYCLNDVHRAAGGEERHSPNRWTRTDAYQALEAELTPEMALAPAESIRGGAAPGTYVCKELVYAYAMWVSAAFHLRVIRAFDELISGDAEAADRIARGQAKAAPNKIVGELAILECFTRLLRPSPSSQVAMLEKIAEQNGLKADFLPGYVVDAPADVDGSSMPTAPITKLLQEHRIATTAIAYNELLRDAGMIEQRTRKSTTKGEKRFWCVTERGQRYGKNLTNPSSPRETQPHWYVDRFSELHRIVSGRLLGNGGAQ